MMLAIDPSFQMWASFAIILVAIGFYIADRVPMELTSLGVIIAFLMLFQFWPLQGPDGEILLSTRTILQGFAEPALIAIISLLVIGQALIHTGALDEVADFLVDRGNYNPRTVTFLSLIIVLILSAIMNNTPVVVIFIPIVSVLAVRMKHTVSYLLMPLSFAAILGGNLTLIGSSTNLLVSGAMESITGHGLSFFELTIPGLVLAAVGFVYLIFFAPIFLHDRASLAGKVVGTGGKQFIVQIQITEGSRFEGIKAISGLIPGLEGLTVSMVMRGRDELLPPFDELVLVAGDILIVAATRDVLTKLLKELPDIFKGFVQDHMESEIGNIGVFQGEQMLAESVVAPASAFGGRTLPEIGFHGMTECVVLGIQRRKRMLRASINRIRLEAGDVLLILGHRDHIQGLRNHHDVILLEWSAADLPFKGHARRALMMFGVVIALAATGIVPITITAILGAGAMLAAGCITIRQAARAIDRRIVLLIASALAMGAALNATGGANYIAHHMLSLFEGSSAPVVLSAFFLLVAFMTNILSNNATAVLFTPIAISIAESLEVDPIIFVVTVIFAANCSFATPMGYQTNLLVMGPGHYRFSDFLKLGVPLIFILWAVFTAFAPWYYGLL